MQNELSYLAPITIPHRLWYINYQVHLASSTYIIVVVKFNFTAVLSIKLAISSTSILYYTAMVHKPVFVPLSNKG